MQVIRKQNGAIMALLAWGIAMLTAAILLFLARMQLTRPTMRDAVFIRRIEKLMQGEERA